MGAKVLPNEPVPLMIRIEELVSRGVENASDETLSIL